jgi:hypothetical protein
VNEALRHRSGERRDQGLPKRANEEVLMRKFVLGAAVLALLSPIAATSASAHPYGHGYRGGSDRDVRREVRECRHELRRADSRREYERERRECRREISRARRDNWRDGRYDRYDRYGYGYGDRYGYRGW